MNELISAMVGRFMRIASRYLLTPGKTYLSIQHLSTKYEPYLQDADVRKVVLVWSCRLVEQSFLRQSLIRTRAAGRVYQLGRLMNYSTAAEAMDAAL